VLQVHWLKDFDAVRQTLEAQHSTNVLLYTGLDGT